MALEITMPQLSDTMSEGTIIKWYKQVGDSVKRGDALAEVATDKANLEIESFNEGTILRIDAQIGAAVKVGAVIAILGKPGEQVAEKSTTEKSNTETHKPLTGGQVSPQVQVPTTPQSSLKEPSLKQSSYFQSPSVSDERIKISPLAKNVAKSHGIDVSTLQGTGEGGRIVRRDIEQALQAPSVSQPAQRTPQNFSATQSVPAQIFISGATKTEPLSKMRQTIATRMVESVTTIPHFYVTTKICMDAAVEMRESLKTLPQYEGLSYNHIIIKAAALALQRHPIINSCYREGSVYQPGAINIGIITAVPGGLLIPIVKHADQLSLADIVVESRGLVQRARAGKPKADDLVDGTFSISNMGMFDVENFTAIINPSQGAIIAVSAIQKEPIVEGTVIRPAAVMRVTASVDHRIIDGVMAGEFLSELKRILEQPIFVLA
ncbi:2-oxo acid dehydrogenase subunit E2 [bacterium]|nr:2-oxo acid dehydrogenase subunit E2 [bacterium]